MLVWRVFVVDSVRNRAKFLVINFCFVLWFSRRCCDAANATQTAFWSIPDQRTKHKRFRSFFCPIRWCIASLLFSAIYWKIFDSIQTLETSSSSTSIYSVVWRSHASQEAKWIRRKWNKILRMLTALASVQSTCNSFTSFSLFFHRVPYSAASMGVGQRISRIWRVQKKNAIEPTTYEILLHCDRVDV